MDLHQQRVVVLGGTSGIGYATAKAAAQAYLFCLTQPFATGSILTVDGGAVLA